MTFKKRFFPNVRHCRRSPLNKCSTQQIKFLKTFLALANRIGVYVFVSCKKILLRKNKGTVSTFCVVLSFIHTYVSIFKKKIDIIPIVHVGGWVNSPAWTEKTFCLRNPDTNVNFQSFFTRNNMCFDFFWEEDTAVD